MKIENFKAHIIEASAGTGKTRYLTEQFFSLYAQQRSPEILKKVVAVTFSEKAAIEMKERLLKKIYQEIFSDLEDKEKIELENILLKLQISTIHSFCQRLLRRFYFLAGIDPYFEIIEEGASGILFNKALYKFLNTETGKKHFAEISKIFKLNHFKTILFSFLNSHPHILLGSSEGKITNRLYLFYHEISRIHFLLKKELSYLDFDDLEKLTFQILKNNPEALNILEDFDEKINFIFIDEFQDTNLLQWEIVKELFLDWLAGYGAKAESGEKYGIVIVGDRKQSIYKFRGAESKLFDDAKEVLADYFEEKVLSENFRSSGKIVEFVNKVFENEIPWKQQKLIVCEKNKNIPSKIEINLFQPNGEEGKKAEYQWVCKRIIKLIEEKVPVFEDDKERPIEFRDIAIIIRKRKGKYFKMLEELLADFGIPYVIIGSFGFYQEEEIIMLLSLLFALVDPEDKLSLWNVKNSILNMDKDEIEKWRNQLSKKNLDEVIEEILNEKKIWEKLDVQQIANCEKFLMILNQKRKYSLFQIAMNLRQMAESFEEAKADVFSVQQNAVKINTVHGAKGLEFPCVFLLNIEEGGTKGKNEQILYLKDKGRPSYRYVWSGEGDELFKKEFSKESQEEEKRILYVALTRPSQYLFITGLRKKSLWVNMIEKVYPDYPAEEIGEVGKLSKKEKKEKETLRVNTDFVKITSYTEKKGEVEITEDLILGEVIHRVLREISEKTIPFSEKKFYERVDFYLKKKIPVQQDYKRKISRIFENINNNAKIKEVIEKDGQVELPFIYEENGEIFEGRIDKVIVENGKAKIFDYKLTVKNPEIFREQMDIYTKAVKKIFNLKEVKRYLVSLEEGKIYMIE